MDCSTQLVSNPWPIPHTVGCLQIRAEKSRGVGFCNKTETFSGASPLEKVSVFLQGVSKATPRPAASLYQVNERGIVLMARLAVRRQLHRHVMCHSIAGGVASKFSLIAVMKTTLSWKGVRMKRLKFMERPFRESWDSRFRNAVNHSWIGIKNWYEEDFFYQNRNMPTKGFVALSGNRLLGMKLRWSPIPTYNEALFMSNPE